MSFLSPVSREREREREVDKVRCGTPNFSSTNKQFFNLNNCQGKPFGIISLSLEVDYSKTCLDRREVAQGRMLSSGEEREVSTGARMSRFRQHSWDRNSFRISGVIVRIRCGQVAYFLARICHYRKYIACICRYIVYFNNIQLIEGFVANRKKLLIFLLFSGGY